MGKVTGFLELDRQDQTYIAASERISNFKEFSVPLREETLREQASRCMDCGIPFCHDMKGLKGCPVNNQIPDWNNLVYEGDWQAASENLHSTNNFPEVTGRICPAPCEASCTLNLIESPVTIKSIECAIVDKAWENGWIMPQVPAHKTGKKIAIIGSGPAGMAAAQQLARAGHDVNLYEKNQKIGGLMRYGIPDFKMEKVHIDRRVIQMTAEGVTFHLGVKVGDDVALGNLVDQHDAVILSGGAERPRDLPIKGRNLKGVHFAMEFLPQQNRRVSNEAEDAELILAKDRHVVVIGGGDTGSDCIGTSFRQRAVSVTQLEILPSPPTHENKGTTWPNWPNIFRTSTSQEEGADREFSIATEKFIGDIDGNVEAIRCHLVDKKFNKIEGSEYEIARRYCIVGYGLRVACNRRHDYRFWDRVR